MNSMDVTRDEVDEVFGENCCCTDCPFFSYHYEPEGRYRACNLLDTGENYELCPGLED